MDFRLFVTIYKMYHHACDVRAVISRDTVEYATQTISFTGVGTKEMLLKVNAHFCCGVNFRLSPRGLFCLKTNFLMDDECDT